MPTVLAASITSIPGGACTSLPSIVSLTTSAMNSASPRLRVEKPSRRYHLPLVRTGFPIQMVLKLVPELLHNRNCRHGGRVAQRAERPAEHVLGNIADQIDVALRPLSRMEP